MAERPSKVLTRQEVFSSLPGLLARRLLRHMRTPDAIRQRRSRRRLGLRMVQVEISEEAVELLRKRGYDPREDNTSIGLAVTALLSDLVLDAARRRPATTMSKPRAAMVCRSR
jgi:hypothetical protein